MDFDDFLEGWGIGEGGGGRMDKVKENDFRTVRIGTCWFYSDPVMIFPARITG